MSSLSTGDTSKSGMYVCMSSIGMSENDVGQIFKK